MFRKMDEVDPNVSQGVKGIVSFNLMKSEKLVWVMQDVYYIEAVVRRERRGLLPVPSSRYLQKQLDTQLHQESLTNSVPPPTVLHLKVHHGFSGQLRNPNPWPTLPWNGDVLQKPLTVDLHQVFAPKTDPRQSAG